MLVLREDLQESVGSEIRADLFERNARSGFALDPEPDGRDLVTARDNEIGEIELAVEFERARVDGERTRRRAGLGRLVDDAQLHSELGQPEREDETSGPGADNEDIAPRHVLLHDDVFAPLGRNLFKIRPGTPRLFLLNSTSQDTWRSSSPPRIPDTKVAQAMWPSSSDEVDRTRPGLMGVALRHAHIDRKVGATRERRDVIDGESPAPVLLGQTIDANPPAEAATVEDDHVVGKRR